MTPSQAICDLLDALSGTERALADAYALERHHQQKANAAAQDRYRVAARAEKVLALLREQIRHEATRQPVSPSSQLVGTPALDLCPRCNGSGCPACNGHGCVRSPNAREEQITDVDASCWRRVAQQKREQDLAEKEADRG